MRRPLAFLSLTLLATACGPSGADLSVDLETDFVAGVDFVRVRVEVVATDYASDAAAPDAIETTAGAATFVPGRRVAELHGVSLGEHLVRVRLLDASDAIVVTRLVRLTLRAPYALTVVVTRSCAGIECPEPSGDPQLSTCVQGRCASPACIAGATECPSPDCTHDADCVPTSPCVAPVCDDGACLMVPDDHACAVTERCDVTLGCVPRPGVEPPDAGPPDACPPVELACTNGSDDDCDGLTDCADPDCDGATCDDGHVCTTGDRCGSGTCGGDPLACDDGVTCTADTCAEPMGCTHVVSDALCTAMPGGTCDAINDCQYPTCTPASCVAVDGCDRATCVGPMCTHATTCTGTQTCCGGACHATACDDGNPCTTDSFSTTTCACAHVNNAATCNDGNACTTSDHCSGGHCTGSARSCDDSNACTTDGCNTGSGCTHANKATGTGCGGGNVCCSGACVSLSARTHCGACGTTCVTGTSCVTVPGRSGVYTCTCGSNSQCQGEGFGGLSTCYSGVCDCQCSAAEPTTCSGQCSSSATCHEISGHNYCQYP